MKNLAELASNVSVGWFSAGSADIGSKPTAA
jgi:hypothetical protein